jgi:hypothetical protein
MRPGLWDAVVKRDALAIFVSDPEEWDQDEWAFTRWFRTRARICLVAKLIPADAVRCAGRTTIDHVKMEPGMGIKPPDEEWFLVALCEFHNVINPPSKKLRQKEREYLALFYPEVWGE